MVYVNKGREYEKQQEREKGLTEKQRQKVHHVAG